MEIQPEISDVSMLSFHSVPGSREDPNDGICVELLNPGVPFGWQNCVQAILELCNKN